MDTSRNVDVHKDDAQPVYGLTSPPRPTEVPEQ